ncbi:LysR substrate-binding domain-containing protein [Shewanella gelidimarina]|uniref:LysR substrate-binding domain-containing protein n=1 Tax=Shewanella gelidimarina TaxID=56813 RepID=UPI00200D092F|nr:LysR substrate-binding domain-containing protein [Shewanella gelidimarina]MCL1059256.1 LysR substrate-binding domain-containing protein [Shewanella gelidimarina]
MYRSPLTLEALLVLDAIDRRGSFAAAAEQLNKVPSALSYIVQKLEEQLSVTLFVRQGRRSVLTPAGVHLLIEGRKVLGAVSKIAEQTQTIAHGWEPKIKIAVDSILNTTLIFEVISNFLHQYPSIEVDIREEVMNGTWEALINNEVDLVIGASGPMPNQQGIRSINIGTLEHIFVACKTHEILQIESPLNKDDLRQFRTVVVHDSVKIEIPHSTNVIENSLNFYVSSISQKIEAILMGIGIGSLPRSRIEKFLKSGDLVSVPFTAQVQTSDSLMAWKVVNKGKGLQQLRTALEKALCK